ncbi:DUF416 family protein [Fibrella arboris]|uniref:DUF416 family protein n=1 Tax=Fibrella arboris TaxID=3242486 RepID=UPI0035218D09
MYPEQFLSEMAQLPFAKQCLLGLSQAERIIHFFKAFEDEWDTDQTHENMLYFLDKAYEYVLQPDSLANRDLTNILVEVEKGIPDTEEYEDGGTEVIYGQNAALALFCSIKFIKNNDLSSLEEAISKTVDTVDGVTLDKMGNEDYDTQPNLEQEIGLQLDFMEFINNMDINQESVNSLRILSRQNAIVI